MSKSSCVSVRNASDIFQQLLPTFFLLLMTEFFGSLIYMFEPCYNYDTCEFTSLWSAMYFCIVTMTTVGYGDQIPRNSWVRIRARVLARNKDFLLNKSRTQHTRKTRFHERA